MASHEERVSFAAAHGRALPLAALLLILFILSFILDRINRIYRKGSERNTWFIRQKTALDRLLPDESGVSGQIHPSSALL